MSLKCIAPALAGLLCVALAGCKPSSPKFAPSTPAPVQSFGAEDPSLIRDWPQWRHDANHSAHSPAELPENLHLHWVRQYSPREQVWDDELNNDLITYDRIFEPIVLEDRLFVGFNDTDRVVAIDTRTGKELWSFVTDGPVRLPCAAWDGKVYFTSDDGHLYCVKAENGALVWKFRGGPSDRKVLGNGRVVSAWPARGGPAVRDGQVYFAASIWPFMGTFIYALDARTGQVIWVNDSTGAQYIKQPHSAPAFAGVAPQGPLVATKDYLLVPGGRSVPAGFDRRTGRFLYFQLEDNGKGNGGSFVAATEKDFYVHTRLRGTRAMDLKTGRKSDFTVNEPVLTTNRLFTVQNGSSLMAAVMDKETKLALARQGELEAQADITKAEEEGSKSSYKNATNNLASAQRKVKRAEADLAKAQKALGTNYAGTVLQSLGRDNIARWEVPFPAATDIIKAGERLYVATSNSIVTVGGLTNKAPTFIATNEVQGPVLRLLAGNKMLFAVTLDGRILGFGGEEKKPQTLSATTVANTVPAPLLQKAAALVEQADAREGFALCFGVDDGAMVEALAQKSELRITAVDSDPARVESLRRRLESSGLYGTRVAAHVGDPVSFKAPPYIASLIVVGDSFAPRLAEGAILKTIFESLRPYGGTLWVSTQQTNATGLAEFARSQSLPKAQISANGGLSIVREGPLPGSAEWTHQYGNVANTVKSDDRLVKLPLGLLWFGGPTHMDVLPRHGHGPSEQVAGGRLFIEGMDCLSARDVYTGRVLWKTIIPGLDNYNVYYDWTYTNSPLSTIYNQKHIPGANARGANYVSTADAVYFAVSNHCLVLDARTGKITRKIELPKHEGEDEPRLWGFIGIDGDTLLAGDGFALYSQRMNVVGPRRLTTIVDMSASRSLVAFDRHSGEQLWRAESRYGFMHNGIVAGGGRVFCLDRLPKSMEDRLRRRGRSIPSDYRILAFQLRTGRSEWEAKKDVTGTWLSYSPKHDVLLQAGAAGTDRLKDEAEKGVIVYQARDGAILWKQPELKYTGPLILHNDTILTTPTAYKTNAGAFGLMDGKPRFITNPLTGNEEAWRIYRTYGCNYPVACEHLMTFRSGAAGFYDLERKSGTGNFGGFKSSCSANLIAADGVLSAPDYTRTCTCPYQNQTSLAFIHWPELEMWTHNQFGAGAKDGERVKRLGINFGAPGDRLAADGTLWVDFPNVSGSSPNLMVAVNGTTNFFRRHESQFAGEGPAWVMASGVENAETILISPETRKAGPPPPAPKKKAGDDDDDDDDEEHSTSTNGVTAAGSSVTKPSKTEKAYKSVLPAAPYTVRLFFAEPLDLRAGERAFDVDLQDKPVLKDFDIAAAAGGVRKGVVKEFRQVVVKGELEIKMKRSKASTHGPILCGVEVVLEDDAASR